MYSKESDFSIWRDFKAGEIGAYEYIYCTYFPLLYNYGFKVCSDKEITQDCIQELFITLLEKKDTLAENVSIKFYLFKSLRRRIVRVLEKTQKFSNIEEELEFNSIFFVEHILDTEISDKRSAQLIEILNKLPPRQKEAVALRFYDNLSYEEIAKIMEIEISSAYKIIYKAIENLQKQLLLEIAQLLVFYQLYNN